MCTSSVLKAFTSHSCSCQLLKLGLVVPNKNISLYNDLQAWSEPGDNSQGLLQPFSPLSLQKVPENPHSAGFLITFRLQLESQ